jgi:hypothetical protein
LTVSYQQIIASWKLPIINVFLLFLSQHAAKRHNFFSVVSDFSVVSNIISSQLSVTEIEPQSLSESQSMFLPFQASTQCQSSLVLTRHSLCIPVIFSRGPISISAPSGPRLFSPCACIWGWTGYCGVYLYVLYTCLCAYPLQVV